MVRAAIEQPTVGSAAPARLKRSWVLVAVCLGQFIIQLDLTVVNVALPSMARDLGASTSQLQWVADAYNLTVAALLLAGGRAGDRLGHKRVYLVGLSVFAIGSALCAAAPDAPALIGFRVVQGVGAAIELPATLAILTHTFPDPAERAQAVGVWAGAAGSSLVIGPVLGGGLVTAFGWRAVFVINLPVTVAVVALSMASMTDAVDRSAAGLDLPGQILGAATLALFTAGAIEGGRQDFLSSTSVSLLAAGTAAAAGFVWIERRARDPMLPLGYFARPAYAVANADGLVMGFVSIGLLFLLALFFQQVQGQSAVSAGLRFVPWAATFVLVGPIVGRGIKRTGSGTPMTLGCCLLAVGALFLARVHAASGYTTMWWPLVMLGAGYGLLSTPMAAVVLGAVPSQRAGMASSTNLTARLVGGVFGVAVLGALLPSGQSGPVEAGAFTSALRAGLYVCAAVAAAGAAITATLIRPERARRGATPS